MTSKPTSWTEHRDPGMGRQCVYEYELAACKRILISRFYNVPGSGLATCLRAGSRFPGPAVREAVLARCVAHCLASP